MINVIRRYLPGFSLKFRLLKTEINPNVTTPAFLIRFLRRL